MSNRSAGFKGTHPCHHRRPPPPPNADSTSRTTPSDRFLPRRSEPSEAQAVWLGFVRIATNHRLGAAAVSLSKARSVVEGWLRLPQVRVLTPAPNHFGRVMDLMAGAMGSGALVSDAVLAAHAIQDRATLCSNDSDFSRFAGLSWRNPLLD